MDLRLMLVAPLRLTSSAPGELAQVAFEVPDMHCAGCGNDVRMMVDGRLPRAVMTGS